MRRRRFAIVTGAPSGIGPGLAGQHRKMAEPGTAGD